MFDMNHLHPMIVHFPIALLLVGFLFEIMSLFIKKEFFGTASFYLLILGTLGVIGAYISGDMAGDGISETGMLKTALETHEEAALIALWTATAAAIFRIAFVILNRKVQILKWVSFILFLCGAIAVGRTGYYGGQLVYKYAAGVQFNFGQNFPASTPTNSLEVEND